MTASMTYFRTIVAESDGSSAPVGWYFLTWAETNGERTSEVIAYGPFTEANDAVSARNRMLAKLANTGQIRANLYMPDGTPFVSPRIKQ
jgi:hypothetical protein